MGQVGSERVAYVELASSDSRNLLVVGEGGVNNPRAYLERHQVIYGGPAMGWRGRERAQVVELPPEGEGVPGGQPAAEA